MISQITASPLSPANLHKSTLPSVCPVLTSTPPSFAIKGNICPGRTSCAAFEMGFAKILIVSSLSPALIPVSASTASTETVNAVSYEDVFALTIGLSSNLFAVSFVTDTQIKPFAFVAIKFTFCGVLNAAA